MEYIDLVLDNGELVRVSFLSKFYDDVYETIENTMKRRDWWSSAQWDKCTAEYLGHNLDRVNMSRVVGML